MRFLMLLVVLTGCAVQAAPERYLAFESRSFG